MAEPKTEDNVAVDITNDPIDIDMGNIDSLVDKMVDLEMKDGSKQSVEEDVEEDEDGDVVAEDTEEDDVEEDEDGDVEDNEEEDEDDDLIDDEDEQEPTLEFDDDTEVEIMDGEKKVNVKLGEMKTGYMRQQDYSRKTQEVKQLREETSKIQEIAMVRLSQDITKYQQMLDKANTIDMMALANTNPAEYQKVQASVAEINKRIAVEEANMATFSDDYQKAKVAQKQEEIKVAEPVIAEAIPDWGPEVAKGMLAHFKENGFSDADMVEVQNLTNPHLIIALHKAMRFDKAKAKAKAKRSGKPSTAKSPTKTIKAKSSRDANVKQTRKQKDLRSKLTNSNDPEAIADMIARQLVK